MNQVVYESNLDFQDSYDALLKSSLFLTETNEKGMLSAKFKDTKTIFWIAPNGKIQVLWRSLEEKKVLLKILKNILVPKLDQKLWLRPTKQSLFIPYPPPRDFKLYWCEEETEYTKSITDKESEELNDKILSFSWTYPGLPRANRQKP